MAWRVSMFTDTTVCVRIGHASGASSTRSSNPKPLVASRTDVSWSRFASAGSTKTVVRSLTGKCGTSTASETDSCGTWRYATLALEVRTSSQRYKPEQRGNTCYAAR